jgi:hypothetical protein
VSTIYHELLLCFVERAIDLNIFAGLREDGNTKSTKPKVWMAKQVLLASMEVVVQVCCFRATECARANKKKRKN